MFIVLHREISHTSKSDCIIFYPFIFIIIIIIIFNYIILPYQH